MELYKEAISGKIVTSSIIGSDNPYTTIDLFLVGLLTSEDN